MQITYQQTIEVKAVGERVFELLSDIESLHKIWSVLGPAEDNNAGPAELGDTWLFSQQHGGEPCDVEYEVADLRAGELIEWVGTSPYGTCTYTWRIEQISGGSRLTLGVCSNLPAATDGATARTFEVNSKDETLAALQRIKKRAES